MTRKDTVNEWICTNCGKKERKGIIQGRPIPGTCPRALKSNGPHRWVKNRSM